MQNFSSVIIFSAHNKIIKFAF